MENPRIMSQGICRLIDKTFAMENNDHPSYDFKSIMGPHHYDLEELRSSNKNVHFWGSDSSCMLPDVITPLRENLLLLYAYSYDDFHE